MKSIIRYGLSPALILAAAPGVAACGDSGGDSGMGGMDHGGSGGNPSASVAPGANFNSADVTFAQMMIPHHRQAVEMAELAATRAADPEIKQLATAIKGAQQPEIDLMTGWLTSWGQAPEHMGSGHGMMSEHDMGSLKSLSGTEFDKEFARMMIAHHDGAIEMARDVQQHGTNSDVKRLASAIEQAQAAEVQQMQKILDRL